MTHQDLDQQYDKVLGLGVYSPQVLLSRIRRELEAQGFTVSLETSDDLRTIPIEAVPAAIAYLQGKAYQAKPDPDAAARLTRKAG